VDVFALAALDIFALVRIYKGAIVVGATQIFLRNSF
jgi:hypothetical protein